MPTYPPNCWLALNEVQKTKEEVQRICKSCYTHIQLQLYAVYLLVGLIQMLQLLLRSERQILRGEEPTQPQYSLRLDIAQTHNTWPQEKEEQATHCFGKNLQFEG